MTDIIKITKIGNRKNNIFIEEITPLTSSDPNIYIYIYEEISCLPQRSCSIFPPTFNQDKICNNNNNKSNQKCKNE